MLTDLNPLIVFIAMNFLSRHAEKYVRRGRLDWPEGAASRESIKSVMKLPRLQVPVFYMVLLWNLRVIVLLLGVLTALPHFART